MIFIPASSGVPPETPARRRLLAGAASAISLRTQCMSALAAVLGGSASALASAAQEGSLQELAPLAALDGMPLDLRQYVGKALLLNLWATWCTPCIAEMPSLQALRAAHGPGGRGWLEVLAVNAGQSINEVEGFLKERRLQLPVALDLRKQVLSRWRVRVLPTTLLFDSYGRLRTRWVGERDWGGDDMLSQIDAALRPRREERAGT